MSSAVGEVDSNLPIFDVRTQIEQASQSIAQERLFATLLSSFGFLALLLAALGLYGVLSHSVARRRQEIGIRVALGRETPRLTDGHRSRYVVGRRGHCGRPGHVILADAMAGGLALRGGHQRSIDLWGYYSVAGGCRSGGLLDPSAASDGS
jgi:hypothetical protein